MNTFFFTSFFYHFIFCAPNYSYLKRIAYIFGSDPNFYYLLLWEIYTRKLLELNFLLLHRYMNGQGGGASGRLGGWLAVSKNTVLVDFCAARKFCTTKTPACIRDQRKKRKKRRASRGSKNAASANRKIRFAVQNSETFRHPRERGQSKSRYVLSEIHLLYSLVDKEIHSVRSDNCKNKSVSREWYFLKDSLGNLNLHPVTSLKA